MGIFNEFNKKEKPVFTGSRFGFGAGGGAGSVESEKASGGVKFNDSSYTYHIFVQGDTCLLYTSPSPRDGLLSRMPSSA